MSELLLYDVGIRKHDENIHRAERNVTVSRHANDPNHSLGRWVVVVLVAVASHIQPNLHCELPQSIEPASA
jgi:hypothetical protein